MSSCSRSRSWAGNGALCNAVTGTAGSGALLADLERSSVFISVDSAGQWYQQHQLFAEALRLDLSRTRPDLVPVLHGRAARWLELAGDRETATEHAIAARDVAAASGLIAGQVQVMAASGRWAAIRRWLSQLSWPEAMQDPELAYARAISAALDNRIDKAVEWAAVARTGPPGQKDAEGLPLGFRADFAEASVGVNDVARAEAAAQRAVRTAPTAGWEGIVLAGLGQAQYLQGRTGEAVATLRRAVGQIPDANPVALAFGVANLALAEASLGVPSRADPMLDRLLGVLGGAGADRSPFGAVMQLACGERERRRGDLRGAADRFKTAIEILGTAPRSAWLANSYVLLAATQRLLGDSADARLSLDRADEILDRLPDPGALPSRSAELRQMLAAPHHHATEFGEQLSDRETAVLGLLAEGLSQRQIAGQLFISHNTVKSHLKTAYRKLGVASREDAISQLAALEARAAVPAQSGEPPGRMPPAGGAVRRLIGQAPGMSGFWCVIVVSGELDERFGDAFADLSVRAGNGTTELTGSLHDQSQLLGVLHQLFDLGLDIESMSARLGPHDAGDLPADRRRAWRGRTTTFPVVSESAGAISGFGSAVAAACPAKIARRNHPGDLRAG